MTLDYTKGFEISDDGLILENGVVILSGADAPSVEAPLGSRYFRTNGYVYRKITAGTGTDKWQRWALAEDVLFSESGWLSTNAHDAIIEAKNDAIALVVTHYELKANGNVADGVFIGRDANMANKKVVLPFDTLFIDLTWQNARTNVSFDVEVYKNGTDNIAGTGTVSGTIGTNNIPGVGTSFTTELTVGENIFIAPYGYEVTAINSDTSVTVRDPIIETFSASAFTYGHLCNIFSVRNSTYDYGKFDCGDGRNFDDGDYLYFKYIDYGTNCSDLILDIYGRKRE